MEKQIIESLKVSISIGQRVTLQINLPVSGNLKEIVVARDLRKKIGFTQEEMLQYGMSFTDKSVNWNPEAANEAFEYEFTAMEVEVIKSILTLISQGNSITESTLVLFELFGISTSI